MTSPAHSPSPIWSTWRRTRDYLHRARTRLWDFQKHLGVVDNPVEAPHLEFLAAELDAFLAGPDSILLALMPPGSSKTLYCGRLFPAMLFGLRPRTRILSLSASELLAGKSGAAIKQIIESPAYNQLFPRIAISKSSSSVTDFAVTVDGRPAGPDMGTFRAFGIGSAILGNRAELIVLDDIVTMEAANNPAQLLKIHEIYDGPILSRLVPRGKIIIVCQRTAAYDIAGYVLAKAASAGEDERRIRVLKLPMVATDTPLEPDLLGRAPGEPLWPAYFTDEMLADARRSEFIWKTMYQQEPPADSGSWVAPENIKIVDIVPAFTHKYIAMDIAISDNRGDYTVIMVATLDADRNLFILDAWRKKVETGAVVTQLIQMVKEHKPLEVLADDDNVMKTLRSLLAQMARDAHTPIPLKLIPMRGQDKATRAAPLRGWFNQGKVYLKRGEWNRWLVNELLIFPNAVGDGVDDGVDAMSLFGRRLASMASPAATTPPKPAGNPAGSFYDQGLFALFEDNELKGHGRPRI